MNICGSEITVSKPMSYLFIFDRAIMPLPGDKPLIIGRATIIATFADVATSGVDSAELYIDDELKTSFVSGVEYTLNERLLGDHTIKIVAYDKAGNKAVKEIRATIYNLNIFKDF
ncbi:MAG: hypothetical protein U9O96_06725 [Candidatus Thermoplasmatota archaeon]|nr:hypothetical protein [Candidatus Thermoplasmatota archaeon]